MINLRRSTLYGRNSFYRYGIVLHIIIIISIYISYKLMYKLDYIEGNSLNKYDLNNKSRNLVKRKKGEEEHINIMDKKSSKKKPKSKSKEKSKSKSKEKSKEKKSNKCKCKKI